MKWKLEKIGDFAELVAVELLPERRCLSIIQVLFLGLNQAN